MIPSHLRQLQPSRNPVLNSARACNLAKFSKLPEPARLGPHSSVKVSPALPIPSTRCLSSLRSLPMCASSVPDATSDTRGCFDDVGPSSTPRGKVATEVVGLSSFGLALLEIAPALDGSD